jgi:hypothetical protein
MLAHVFFVNKIGDNNLVREVQDAARLAELPGMLTKLSYRNFFLRAMRRLAKSGVLGAEFLVADKFYEDEEEIRFQLSVKEVSDSGVSYLNMVQIRYDKDKACITSQDKNVESKAKEAFDLVMGKMKSADILRFVTRVIKKQGFIQMALRDGVYALPQGAEALLDKIERFFSALNVTFFRLSAEPTGQQKELLVKTVGQDVKQQMDAMRKEIVELSGKGEISNKIKENRRQDLARSLRGYAAWAQSLGTQIQDIIDSAQESGKALVQLTLKPRDVLLREIQSGTETDPLVLALADGVAPVPLNFFETAEDPVAIVSVDQPKKSQVQYIVSDEG